MQGITTDAAVAHLRARFDTVPIPKGLKEGPEDSSRAEAADVASQFETIFLKQMVSGMRKTTSLVGGDGMFGSGPGSDTYTQWFDNHISNHLTGTGGIGITEVLMREFERWNQIPSAEEEAAKVTTEKE